MTRGLLAFVHVFKAAGTTLTGILRRNFSLRHFDTRLIQDRPAITAAQLKRALLLYPKVESIAGHGVRTFSDLRSGFPDIRFYVFMREPISRIVSGYLFRGSNRIRHGRPFESDAEIEADLTRFMNREDIGYCRIFSPDEGRADQAIEVFETQVGFLGLVEHFDESLALLRNWIGRPDFDLRYRRMNVAEGRAERERKYGPHKAALERLASVTKELVARPAIRDLMAERRRQDILLFEHLRSQTFERMRRTYDAGPGPFNFEVPNVAADSIAGWLYRDLIGRPLVPLITPRAAVDQSTPMAARKARRTSSGWPA